MRIGILTLPLHTNYGGILQAYALQTVLERMGHEVVVFDTPNKCSLPPFKDIPKCFLKRIVKKLLGRNQKIFYEYYQNNKVIPVVSQNTQRFINSYIHRKEISNFKELDGDSYDAIVVGSDQVWRPIYFNQGWRQQGIKNAYLAFASKWNIKRLSYAVSFGTDKKEYSDAQIVECRKLVQMFDAVSVREKSAVKQCRKYFNQSASHVLDPTLLLSVDDYISLFKISSVEKSYGSLLTYVLDSSELMTKYIRDIAQEKKLEPFNVNNPYEYDDSRPLQERVKPSVEKWLRGFYDAKFVITDSFHACVFSIIFHKQFVVVGNKERGMSRFESLLEMFGLEDRLVNIGDDISSLSKIDYAVVDKIYDALKKESKSFLFNALK